MNQLVKLLDANGDQKISGADATVFLNFYDTDLDGKISKNELLSAVNQTLFDMVFEEELNYGREEKTDLAIEQYLLKLFPDDYSTLDIPQLENLYTMLDTNHDQTITR